MTTEWFLASYELVFTRLEVWLACLIVLGCARKTYDDVMSSTIVLASTGYVSAGVLLGCVYLYFRTLA